MRARLALAAAALVIGSSVYAWGASTIQQPHGQPRLQAEPDRQDAPHSARVATPNCKTIEKMKADFDDGKVHFSTLSPGQFHFVEGVYVGSPSTPEGLPPGDGVMLVTHEGDKDGVLVWTRGSLACGPLPIPAKLIEYIKQIKTGALDDNGQEL